MVAGLTDKIERLQLSRADHAAVNHLEDRIAGLVEKLDASDARLSHLEAIERGLAELLIHLEHQRLPHADRLRRLRCGSTPTASSATCDARRNCLKRYMEPSAMWSTASP